MCMGVFADALGAIGHVAFVEMLQQTAVVQVQIVLRILLIGRLRPRNSGE